MSRLPNQYVIENGKMSENEVVYVCDDESPADTVQDDDVLSKNNINATETDSTEDVAIVDPSAILPKIACGENDNNSNVNDDLHLVVESSTTMSVADSVGADSLSPSNADDTVTVAKPVSGDSECTLQNINCSNDTSIGKDNNRTDKSTEAAEDNETIVDMHASVRDTVSDSELSVADTPPVGGVVMEVDNDTLCDIPDLEDQKETTGTPAIEKEQDQTDQTNSCPQEASPKPAKVDIRPTSTDARPATTGAESQPPPPPPISPSESVYHVKRVTFHGTSVALVTQNENGPCPLLAIANVLLLQRRICLPAQVALVTAADLMQRLADCLFQQAPNDVATQNQLDYEQNRHDALAILHKLQTGLDVNVKFTGIGDFEYTPECIVFDLLGLRLCHGWLVDPECPADVTAVGNCSYNQLVEKIIEQKSSPREELVTEALIAEEFLNRTAAQLTYYGLSELSTTLKEGELCVFFRNNHFCPLYHRKNELFLLVTDQGFLTESRVVWEVLANVEGDGCFVDADLHTFVKAEPSSTSISSHNLAPQEQIDQDYLVALSLQEEQDPDSRSSSSNVNVNACLSDHELAMRLQAEEDHMTASDQAQPPSSLATSSPRRPTAATTAGNASPAATATEPSSRHRDKSDCSIL